MKHLFKHLLLMAALVMTLMFTQDAAYAATSSVAGTYTVTASSLYIRSGAGTSYKSLGTVHKGDTVTVTDSKAADGKTWAKITYKNQTGWLSMAYLTKKSSASTDSTSTSGSSTSAAKTNSSAKTSSGTTVKNGWYKESGTWSYYSKGTVKYTSNALHVAYKKIKGKSSGSNYYLIVDRSHFTVDVFRKSGGDWVPVKIMKCSVGKKSTPTPAGTWTIFSRWKILGFPNKAKWEFYPVEFSAKYHACFHSTIYHAMTKYKNNASQALAHASEAKPWIPTLGKAISHGCVRLSIENAKWIWDNCPNGTKVLVY